MGSWGLALVRSRPAGVMAVRPRGRVVLIAASLSIWAVFVRMDHPVNDHSERPLPSWAITRSDLAEPSSAVARPVTEQIS